MTDLKDVGGDGEYKSGEKDTNFDDAFMATQEAQHIQAEFVKDFTGKFLQGARENKFGAFFDIPLHELVHHSREEILDLVAYQYGIEARLKLVRRRLETALDWLNRDAPTKAAEIVIKAMDELTW